MGLHAGGTHSTPELVFRAHPRRATGMTVGGSCTPLELVAKFFGRDFHFQQEGFVRLVSRLPTGKGWSLTGWKRKRCPLSNMQRLRFHEVACESASYPCD